MARGKTNQGRKRRGMTKISHPGEKVMEHLANKKWKQADLARASGLHHKTVGDVCRGNIRITARTALGLAKALDKPVAFWLELQSKHDLLVAQQRMKETK